MGQFQLRCVLVSVLVIIISVSSKASDETAVANFKREDSPSPSIQTPVKSAKLSGRLTRRSLVECIPQSYNTPPLTQYPTNNYKTPQYPPTNSYAKPLSANYNPQPPAYRYGQTPAPYGGLQQNYPAPQNPTAYNQPQISGPYNAPSPPSSQNTYPLYSGPQSAAASYIAPSNQPSYPQAQNPATYNPSSPSYKPPSPPVYKRQQSTQNTGYNPTPQYSPAPSPPQQYAPVAPYVHHTKTIYDSGSASSYAQSYNKFVPINRFNHFYKPAIGQYDVEFEAGNGIRQQESGYLKNVPAPYANGYQNYNNNNYPSTVANVKTGSVSWITPEGIPISFSYIADENGYRPYGAHLYTGSDNYANNYKYDQAGTTNYEVTAPSHYLPKVYP